MIYITGGDQSRFMDIVLNTEVHEAIRQAYMDGALIAGTSAGAAVMSKKMITGNEFRHPEYTGDFRTIEANNMEIREGLGLIGNAIVDQHFVWRMRMNRLISVALENPGDHCFGIDESTALVIHGNRASVFGESQVIRLMYTGSARTNEKGLIGGRGLILDVLLPGDTLDLAHSP
jgi:cyanophycinase